MRQLKGWLKLNRSIVNWKHYNDVYVKAVFLHCLIYANSVDGHWNSEDADVEYGSFISSQRKMAKELGMSTNKLVSCLKILEKSGELKCEAFFGKYTKITVNNYAKYQGKQMDEIFSAEPTEVKV